MTGKDFSGPVPEIRTPSKPPQIVEQADHGVDMELDDQPNEHNTGMKKRSLSQSDGDVIVIGHAASFDEI